MSVKNVMNKKWESLFRKFDRLANAFWERIILEGGCENPGSWKLGDKFRGNAKVSIWAVRILSGKKGIQCYLL